MLVLLPLSLAAAVVQATNSPAGVSASDAADTRTIEAAVAKCGIDILGFDLHARYWQGGDRTGIFIYLNGLAAGADPKGYDAKVECLKGQLAPLTGRYTMESV